MLFCILFHHQWSFERLIDLNRRDELFVGLQWRRLVFYSNQPKRSQIQIHCFLNSIDRREAYWMWLILLQGGVSIPSKKLVFFHKTSSSQSVKATKKITFSLSSSSAYCLWSSSHISRFPFPSTCPSPIQNPDDWDYKLFRQISCNLYLSLSFDLFGCGYDVVSLMTFRVARKRRFFIARCLFQWLFMFQRLSLS